MVQSRAEKLIRFLIRVLFWVMTLLSGVLLVVSVLTRIYYDLYQDSDIPRLTDEYVPALLAGIVLILFLARRVCTKETQETHSSLWHPLSRIMIASIVWTAIVCSFFIFVIRGFAVNDALMLDGIVNAFLKGDYSSLISGYLSVYPNNLGYVMIGEWIARIFGESNFRVYQILNLLSILITLYMLYQITWEITENQSACDVMALLSFGMLYLDVYVTLVYNDILSLAPEAIAIYLCVRFLKRKRIRDAVFSIVWITAACIIKSNCMIAAIAIGIGLLLGGYGWAKSYHVLIKVVVSLIFPVALLLSVQGSNLLMRNHYATVAGLEKLSDGVPSTGWIAMGLQEDGGGEWGWYTGLNIGLYYENGEDTAAADVAAHEYISMRLQEFVERPLHGCRFFARKFIMQWTDASCLSLRNMELTARHQENNGLRKFLVEGRGRDILYFLMNVYESVLYLGFFLFCLRRCKKSDSISTGRILALCIPVLFIFGGMVFHEFWEGQSRYVLRYVTMMLPVAAAGIAGNFLGKMGANEL